MGILIISSCGKRVKPDGKRGYLTTKRNRKLHGMGFKSSDWVVKKYYDNSSIHYDRENKRFYHVIQLPEF